MIIKLTPECLEVGKYKPSSVTIFKESEGYTLELFFNGINNKNIRKTIKRKNVVFCDIELKKGYTYNPQKYSLYKYSETNKNGNYINYYEVVD